LAGCFYVDTTGLFEDNLETTVAMNGATSTLQAAVNAGSKGQSLILIRPQGVMEVCMIKLIYLHHDNVRLAFSGLESAKAGVGLLHIYAGLLAERSY
jgi:hypothetical protein